MKKFIMTIAAVAILFGVGAGLSTIKDIDNAKIPVGGNTVTKTAYIPVGGASVDYVAYNSTDNTTVTVDSIPVGGA
jgi:hypothetical protein